jgi:hypothetical protein
MTIYAPGSPEHAIFLAGKNDGRAELISEVIAAIDEEPDIPANRRQQIVGRLRELFEQGYRKPLNLTPTRLTVLKAIRRATDVTIPYRFCPRTCAAFEEQGWVFADRHSGGYYLTGAGYKRLDEAEEGLK